MLIFYTLQRHRPLYRFWADSDYLLPQDVIDKTIDKYLEAYELLTGKKL